ncbi:MAG: helix-turn-helix domain-containing protein [Cellvibrio sp.]
MHIFERIREERERLGFTQDAFGAIGGVSRRAQSNYESGERSPDLNYLAAIERVGVDVLFVITGKRAEATISGEEELLLKGFRQMDAETKRRTLAMVYSGTPPPPPNTKIIAIHGQAANGNITNDFGGK